VRETLSRIWCGIVDTIYPPLCLLCGGHLAHDERHICGVCMQRLPLIGSPCCPRCSRPLRTRDGRDQLCGVCRLTARAPVEQVAASGEFRGGLRHLIHLFKYKRYQCLAPQLGNLLARRATAAHALDGVHWLAPIPLHWTRQRWRGFNQARELARMTSASSGVPLLPAHALRRVRRTTPQVSLTAAGRAANIKGAFAVAAPDLVRNTRVALVDDVVTTGATSDECARVLLRAGAAAVRLLVVAR